MRTAPPERRRRGSPGALRGRGQATVELALALLLILPAVFYMLYSAEVFTAGIKAQEAEVSGAWDVTGYRLHDFTAGNAGPLWAMAAAQSGTAAQTDLADFDSFTATGRTLRRMLLSDQRLSAGCVQVTAPLAGQAFTTLQTFEYPDIDGYLPQDGYLRCRARANFSVQRVDRNLDDEFTPVPLIDEVAANLDLCGIGAGVQGCPDGRGEGGMILLTDDWALGTAQRNPAGTDDNAQFFKVGQLIYRAHPLCVSCPPEEEPPDDGAGTAAFVVPSVMDAMIGSRVDMGTKTHFLLAFDPDPSNARTVPLDSPTNTPGVYQDQTAHQSPWDDDEGIYLGGRDGYLDRADTHYLGHPSASFNQP